MKPIHQTLTHMPVQMDQQLMLYTMTEQVFTSTGYKDDQSRTASIRDQRSPLYQTQGRQRKSMIKAVTRPTPCKNDYQLLDRPTKCPLATIGLTHTRALQT